MSDSLGPHWLQHTWLPCPSLSPRVCSDSCPLSWWCYLTISYSAVTFSFNVQSFPASEYFSMSQLFASGSQSIGSSASASPSNKYSRMISFRIDWFDLPAVQETQESSLAPQFKSINSWCSVFFMVQLLHPYMTTGKTTTMTIWTLVGKVTPLLFYTLTRFVLAFLPRN